MPEKIFALDIGTRSVVGIILEAENNQYSVVDLLIKEHSERAMLDGQIHDIVAVSSIINSIKSELEQKHGKLEKVCVAAAGRALRTERGTASVNIKGKPFLTRDDILHLELSAVQHAQYEVAEKESLQQTHHYYCVGYSVIHYYLDEQEIGNLIDQNGDIATVEVIATFLPRVVVESLLAALKRTSLELQALTLEPIAAIQVLIPPSMRRLNVALVDIGAGTSDIAITDLGTVVAYGMVPIAGDEVTEAISDQYLLDFPQAEKAKRQLQNHETITISDILGFETEVPKREFIDQIKPTIKKLAIAISKEILTLNNDKSPKAVMLVGGGSLTPDLPQLLAEQLQLPANRVAIRGSDAIPNLHMPKELPKGPELVTPIGIAIASGHNPVHYVTVEVNSMPVRLFDMKTLTVGDALLAAGVKLSRLYGKPGMASIVTVNGKSITIPGRHGQAPKLLKNGRPCSLDEGIVEFDSIEVQRGQDGNRAHATLTELLDETPQQKISINGSDYTISATILLNGQTASGSESINDRDQIVCQLPATIEQLLPSVGLRHILPEITSFYVFVNDEKKILYPIAGKILINGKQATLHSEFDDGDTIVIHRREPITLTELIFHLKKSLMDSIPVTFNGKPLTLTKELCQVWRDGMKLESDDIIHNGDSLSIEFHKRDPFIFQDVFRHIEINMPTHPKGHFILLRNNNESTFYEKIEAGDELKIVWTVSPSSADKSIKPITFN